MATTPEGKVKQWVRRQMLNWYPEAFHYAPPGTHRFGRNGMPDETYLIEGVFVAIEVKADNGKPTALQLKTLGQIKSQGGVAAIIYGKDFARLNAIHNEIEKRRAVISGLFEF